MSRNALLLLALLCLVAPASGQGTFAAPGTIECRQWDDAFTTNFYLGAVIVSLVTGMLAFFSGLRPIEILFPGPWLRRHPSYRYLWVLVVVWLAAATVLVFVPKWYLGPPIYSGVDPAYRQCVTQAFGAAGLLGGRIGAGTAAYAQTPALLLIILAGCASGLLLAFFAGRRKAAAAMRTDR